MAVANVLSTLYSRKKLEGLILYGKVKCLIERPRFIRSTEVEGGYFALLELYAIKCTRTDYFGEEDGCYSTDQLYESNGSVLIATTPEYIGKEVKVFGSGRNGVALKKQIGSMDQDEGVSAFVFRKSTKGEWVIAPNTIKLLLENDIKSTSLEGAVVLGMAYKASIRLDNVRKFYGDKKYKELCLVKEEEASSNGVLLYDENGRVNLQGIDLGLVKHLDSPPKFEYFSDYEEEVKEFDVLRVASARQLVKSIDFEKDVEESCEEGVIVYSKSYVIEVASEFRNVFLGFVDKNYHFSIGKEKVRDIIDKLIDLMMNSPLNLDDGEEKEERIRKRKVSKGKLEEVKKDVAYNLQMLRSGEGECPALDDDIIFTTYALSVICELGDSLISGFNYISKHYGITLHKWFLGLVSDPYALGMLAGSSFGISAADKVFNILNRLYGREEGVFSEKENRFKLALLDGIKGIEGKDTLVKKYYLKSNTFTYYSRFERGLIAKNNSLVRGVGDLIIKEMYGVLPTVSVRDVCDIPVYSEERLEELIEMGVLDIVCDDIILASALSKEFIIYKTFYEKGLALTNIDEEGINSVIKEFEDKKGFQLEELQKDGVRLVKYKAAVLSGCAGSGKTTSSDCLTEVIRKFLPDYDIIYGTPTGKACRRLAEVVGGDVRTLHALFGIGLGGESYFRTDYVKNFVDSKKVYILDEMAMCNTDIMYEVAKNMMEEDLIFFLGDIKQLPPIGRGFPFAVLMKILPCVELGVSKRSAAGSLVNYNCMVLNFVSGDNGYPSADLLFDENTFIKIDCEDSLIAVKAVSLFETLLDRYAEEDIQVITPYVTTAKSWSSTNVNPTLQKMLREKSGDSILFANADRVFYRNDRVLHKNRNSYDMPRYTRQEGLTFREEVTFGAVNGEVGRLIGIVKSTAVSILPFDDTTCIDTLSKELKKSKVEDLIERRELREQDMRDDTEYVGNNNYFVIVEYYDTDIKKNTYVFYRASLKKSISMDSDTVLMGSDLANLDLAYALSTHKMQGSQAKAVIGLFGSTGSVDFVNRNMLNVIITRSQEFVALLGDISGDNSVIARGRKVVSKVKCNDVLSILSGGDEK